MNITPETKSLAAVFPTNGDDKYVIPVYQRNYSWKPEQIEQLFNDIKDEPKGYYVGNLLINTELKDKESSVIDGQQRLTTLSMMLLALWEQIKKKADRSDESYDDFIEITTDIKRQLLIKKVTPRLRLLESDQRIWSDLLNVLKDEASGKWGTHAFFKRYQYLRDELLEGLTLQELGAFFDKLSNVELLKISVPDLSDAYQVFASLNSKGLPLTPLDLLKNLYLSKNGSVNKWKELQDIFSSDDKLDDRKLTQFITNQYDAFENSTDTSLTKGGIVKAYERLFNHNGASYIDTLLERAVIFAEMTKATNKFNYSLEGLSHLDATTSYPFLLNVIKNKDKLQLNEYIDKIVRLIINLYVKRNITLIPKASNLRHEMLSLKSKLIKDNLTGQEAYDYIRSVIHKISPSDEQIELSLREGIYDKNKNTTRFVLINLERQFGHFFNKSVVDSLDDITESGQLRWTIEHILPQGNNLKSEWQTMLSPEDREKVGEIQNTYVHLLGNLTLTPYNSELGNKTFSEKLLFQDGKELVGLNLRIFLNDSINNEQEWTIEKISSRNQLLTQKVLELLSLE
jgi:uncharacterized protein with ParB-like and HNH nuclease domain